MARRIIDLMGQVFSRLVVIHYVRQDERHCAIWLCKCSCDGKDVEVRSGQLTSGNVQSCGCARWRRGAASHAFKHGHSKHRGRSKNPSYRSWTAMRKRCMYFKNISWPHYGGAGIKIDPQWLGEHGFENFLADMGERPAGTSLGRYLDSGDYTKSNCAWQTWQEQRAEARGKKAMLALHAWYESQMCAPKKAESARRERAA